MTNIGRRAATFCESALIVGAGIALVAMLGLKQFAPRAPSGALAVVFPPWTGSAKAIATAAVAGASVVRSGRYSFIVVVRPTVAGYAARAIGAGAWLVVDPQSFSGCLARSGMQP